MLVISPASIGHKVGDDEKQDKYQWVENPILKQDIFDPSTKITLKIHENEKRNLDKLRKRSKIKGDIKCSFKNEKKRNIK